MGYNGICLFHSKGGQATWVTWETSNASVVCGWIWVTKMWLKAWIVADTLVITSIAISNHVFIYAVFVVVPQTLITHDQHHDIGLGVDMSAFWWYLYQIYVCVVGWYATKQSRKTAESDKVFSTQFRSRYHIVSLLVSGELITLLTTLPQILTLISLECYPWWRHRMETFSALFA